MEVEVIPQDICSKEYKEDSKVIKSKNQPLRHGKFAEDLEGSLP
jgi:hypothetical protein